MLRMEIALIIILGFIAYMYYSAERKHTKLHRTFSVLLLVVIVHLVFDAVTIYTVNHLEQVSIAVNDAFHRVFVGTMAGVLYLFYRYIAAVVEEETKKKMIFDWPAKIFLIVLEIIALVFPIAYIQTPNGNYSAGAYVIASYGGVAIYLALCAGILIWNWKQIHPKKRFAIGVALLVEFVVCGLQGAYPTWLISGMITLMTLSFYLTLENPDILRAELTEQKMSMLYLKSQVNPHFLYNTLDTIRIQAQLNGDKKVADLLMRLVDFFRISVKVDRQMVALDDELELLEAYMDLMCYRYPNLHCEYDIDPDLGGSLVPNFILQPLVENSLLHGLKNKGYRGEVVITAKKEGNAIEILIRDSGSGFTDGRKDIIDEMLLHYDKKQAKLEGNSIGILNVQKRIKLLCGPKYGLSYMENETGGVTARLLLPHEEDAK